MRKVLDTIRMKKVYNIPMAEFKKGEWLKLIPADSELIEVQYKNHFLSIHDAKISKYAEKADEGETNERRNKDTGSQED